MGVEEKELFDSPFSVPLTDYNEKGKIKKVRGYVLKRLIKYECKALLPTYLTLLIILVSVIIFACGAARLISTLSVQSLTYHNAMLVLVLSIMGILGIGGTLILMPLIKTSNRFKKCFFGSHGYIMLSLPVTIEEHVLSKHLVAIGMMIVSTVTLVLGIFFITLFGGISQDFFGAGLNGLCALRKASIILKWLNLLLLVIFLIVVGTSFSCIFRRFTSIAKIITIIATVITAEIVFVWYVNLLSTTDVLYQFLSSEKGNFFTTLFGTLFLSLTTVIGYFYQVNYFKKYINI